MSRAFHSAAAVSVGETASATRPSCARWALTSVTTWAARSARLAGQLGAGTQLPAAVAAAGGAGAGGPPGRGGGRGGGGGGQRGGGAGGADRMGALGPPPP